MGKKCGGKEERRQRYERNKRKKGVSEKFSTEFQRALVIS
jgi:hypothetical protein